MNVVKSNLILSLVLLLSFSSTYLHASEWSLAGYVKSFGVLQEGVQASDVEVSEYQAQLQNSIRLMLTSQTKHGHDLEIQYEVQPTFYSEKLDPLSKVFLSEKNSYRIDDLGNPLSSGSYISTNQNLDRINIQYHLQGGELTIGRQAMAFGSARMVNPSDVFLPYGLQALDTEYRVGIDAVRYQHYLSDFSYLDMGLIAGQDAQPENSAIFMRTHYSITGNDIDLMAIQLKDAYLLSAGLQRAFGGFGSWFETAYMDYKDDHYWRTSLGLDYAVNEDIFGMVEYHYNGAGTDIPEEYLENSITEPYRKFGVYLLGRQYLLPSVSATVSPLLTVNGSLVWNVDDGSSLLSVAAETSWSENQYSQLGMYQGLGKEGFDSGNSLQLKSEFGDTSLMIYASYGVYF